MLLDQDTLRLLRLLRPPSNIWMVLACGPPQSDMSVTGGSVQSVQMSRKYPPSARKMSEICVGT